MNNYIELIITAGEDLQEVLIAELSELNFESFTQEENRLIAYSLHENYENIKEAFDEILSKYRVKVTTLRQIENNINWNQAWEENFQPISIDNEIYIKALFHDNQPGFKHQIIIQPKMSFGTGHHETTQLMLELMLQLDFEHAACLDMGCGTGVLAILAERMGAGYTVAVDYDTWCFENTKENFELNNTQHATVILGDAKVLLEPKFLELWKPYSKQIILSNITKNYNLENLQSYHNISNPGTVILVSGFYENDLTDITKEAEKYQMKFVQSKIKNKWCAAQFIQH